MNLRRGWTLTAMVGCWMFAMPGVSTSAQQVSTAAAAGSIEFEVRVTPTGGRPEPALQLQVYLLRKSFAEIRREAESELAKPELEKFVDELNVSAPLKTWMKRTKWVQLNGPEFLTRVTNDDIFDVPEFFDAYIERNAGDLTLGFPVSKAKDIDREKNPAKYEKDRADYMQALRKFVKSNPHTRDAIEVPLSAVNPAQRWLMKESDRKKQAQFRAIQLAETDYFLARAETDMKGHAGFQNVPVGDYWLSTLDGEAMVGDARLKWDVSAPVRAGRTTRVQLSNVNSVRP